MAFDISTAKPVESGGGGFDLSTAKPVDEERSIGERAARVAGLGARSLIKTATAIPTLMAEAVAYPLRAATGGKYFPSPSAVLEETMTDAGLAKPETGVERFSSDVTGVMGGTGITIPFAKMIAQHAPNVAATAGQRIAQQFAQSPGAQVAAAATGGAGSAIAKEMDAGPAGQMLAGVAGAALPSIAGAGAQALTRRVLGGDQQGREALRQTIKQFERAGTMPTAGQATPLSRVDDTIEGMLSKFPGGSVPMARKLETQAAEMGKKVGELADDTFKGATVPRAGLAIESGIKDFIKRFHGQQNTLYDKVDAHLPPGTKVHVGNVTKLLDEIGLPIHGAKHISQGILGNKPLAQLREQVLADAKDGMLPYHVVKQIRSRIGEQLEGSGLAADVTRSQWKRIYGALSEDMKAATRNAGPQAQQAWHRADAFTKAGHTRIDSFLDRISSRDTVEKVFNAATAEVKEGPSTINAVMRSLQPHERKILTAAFVKRMGLATPGKQGAEGDIFSVQTFLTNWNRATPEAKRMLFGSHAKGLHDDLSNIAKVAQRINDSAAVVSNPSGTSKAWWTVGAIGGVVGSIASGNLPLAAKILAGMGAANLTAKMMTNPQFVRWLAQTTKQPVSAAPAAINALTQIAARTNDPALSSDIERFKKSLMRAR